MTTITDGATGMPVLPVALGPGVAAWFTRVADREDPAVGRAGNLSHHRPHVPGVLAADRAAVGRLTDTDPDAWHLMVQVHGRDVGVVDAATPPGTELRDVDALVTAEAGRVLGVAAADCVPVLLSAGDHVAAVHAGRRGMELGILPATLAALPDRRVRAVVGPSIGGCCYEVPAAMQAAVDAAVPGSATTTTWGTPSLDLPAAAVRLLEAHGAVTERVGGCTRCGSGWFSHRADPGAGRHLGLVVRR